MATKLCPSKNPNIPPKSPRCTRTPGFFAPKFYIGAKTCPNNLPRFFPLVVEAALRLGYNSAVPKENTKTRAGSGNPGCLEDKYYEKDHASFVSHCLRCCCCRCCPDRLRRFCFLCCSFFHLCRCRLHCFFYRCCPVRQCCYRWFHFHEECHRCPDRRLCRVEPGVTVSYDPTGSGAGITGATDKTLDIGLSSRALKDDEKADVDGTTIALDGIALSSTMQARWRI